VFEKGRDRSEQTVERDRMKRTSTPVTALWIAVALALSTLSHVSAQPETEPPDRWQPALGDTWQWQLQDEIDPTIDAAIYEIDLFDASPETIATLKADGRRLICYISVGTVEDWRPDAAEFPAEAVGDPYEEWPGERWLDIREIDLLAPVLLARLDLCREKGFDGVEPDNVDAFSNETGFAIDAADQVRFLRWLAAEAHGRGLSIGLKNDPELAADLVDVFDWALTEDCYVDGWCEEMAPFIAAGKPVFMAEYTDQLSRLQFGVAVCPFAASLGFSAILKGRDLDAARGSCPA